MILCHGHGDCHHVHYIVDAASSRQVIGRFGQPLNYGADGFGLSHPLDQLVGDVARVEIGKDKYVCLPPDDAVGRLLPGHRGNDG